jgi:hypothetical protein
MARPRGVKNRPGSMKPGPAAGTPKPQRERRCMRCNEVFLGFNGKSYCSRRCYFLANAEQGDGCWIWKGYKRPGGYGEAYFGSKPNRERVLAHRLAWEVEFGDPGDMVVCHHCDNPSCVNPRHLFLGTRADNNADRNAKDRQAKGERNGPAKLTEAQVVEIRADPRTHREVALQYGVKETAIGSIRLRKTWSHVAPAETDCDPSIWLDAVKATHVRGEKAGRAKLTEADVREIRASKEGCTKLARKYGVGERTIWDITNGRSWKHVS